MADKQQATAAVAEDLSEITHKSLIKLHISYHDIHKPWLHVILLPTHVNLLPAHVIMLLTHVTNSPLTRLLMPFAGYSSSSGSYMQNIQAAFARSSQALLHLLQHDLGLNNTLAALKHYFLLDKGDMLLSFLDTAEEELSKPASEVSVIRLQSLLDLGMDCAAATTFTCMCCVAATISTCMCL